MTDINQSLKSRLKFSLLLLTMNVGCGMPTYKPYYPDKTYGRTAGEGETVATATPTTNLPGNGDAQKQGDPNGDPTTPTDKETPGDGQKAPDQPKDDPAKDQTKDPSPGDKPSPPPPSPDTVSRKLEFKVLFDQNSAKGIRGGQLVSLGALEGTVRQRLVTGPEDGLTLTQTIGDEKGNTMSYISLRDSVADANRHPQAPSISSLKSIQRLLMPVCPNVFDCAERLVIKPQQGTTNTVCFSDPNTGKPMAYPVGPNLDKKEADYSPFFQSYGPYNATIFAGDVPCTPTPAGPYFSETISAKVSKGSLDGLKLELHKNAPITPQYAIIMENIRQNGELRPPFLDETSRLSSRTGYYISDEKRTLVAMVVTSRLSLDVARTLGGGIFAAIIDQLANLDGISADLHYEMCRNLASPAPENGLDHCIKPGG